jgi:hypothetical protein
MNAFGTVFALVEQCLTQLCTKKRAACTTARLIFSEVSNRLFQNSGFQTYILKPTLLTLAFYNTQFWLINLHGQLVT